MKKAFSTMEILEYSSAILIWLMIGDSITHFLKTLTADILPIFYYLAVVVVVFGYVWLVHFIFTKIRVRLANK